MTVKHLLKKIKLSALDMQEIKEAVHNAEQTTSGEIALAICAESDNYSFWELLSSIFLAAFIFLLLLPLAPRIASLYSFFLWGEQNWFLPVFYGIALLATTVIGFAIANIPVIDRIIIPKACMKVTVTNRAFRHFAQSGIYDTQNHSGILIFVSYLEREVRIIADSGIAKKIPQDLWNIIADDLAEGIKHKKTKEGFINAVEKCGELLTEHFPASSDNPNEIPDGLVILED